MSSYGIVSLLLLYVLFAEQGALGVDMVEYVLSGSPTRKELDARLRGKGGPPPPFIQNVSFTYVNISTTLWCCKSVGHEKGLHF